MVARILSNALDLAQVVKIEDTVHPTHKTNESFNNPGIRIECKP